MFDYQQSNSEDETLRKLFSDNFDPTKTIIIEDSVHIEKNMSGKGDVKLLKAAGTSIEIDANFSQQGFLFVSQLYYPGWKAYVDGQEKKIVRANSAYSAVVLDDGSHFVEFRYEPRMFYWGKNITLLTIFTMSIICFTVLMKSKKPTIGWAVGRVRLR